jgi:DNA-binding transcriptional regulator YiaG
MDIWTPSFTKMRMREILGLADMTQERLARALNVSLATVNRWCMGRTAPDPRNRKALLLFELQEQKKRKAAEHDA